MGIEPTPSAWKAEVLPLNYTRFVTWFTSTLALAPMAQTTINMVEGEGFEPSKAEPADLQSAPFGHSGTPPIANASPLFCGSYTYLSTPDCSFYSFSAGHSQMVPTEGLEPPTY